MPGYGETYVEVDASAVNGGIMTMAASGPDMPDEGWESNTWTIFWRYDETSGGITGMSWYLNRENNLIGAIWYDTTTAESEGYQQTDSDFNRWLNENSIENLDWIFNEWSSRDQTSGNNTKGMFAAQLLVELGAENGCVVLWS